MHIIIIRKELRRKTLTIKEKIEVAFLALDEKKGENIKILDISRISSLADYFIIAGGTNKNQVQALVDSVEEKLKTQNVFPKHIEGYSSSGWILLDYEDFIIHIFNEEDRHFYDLERIWKDGVFLTREELGV